jgi:hypothetical protein
MRRDTSKFGRERVQPSVITPALWPKPTNRKPSIEQLEEWAFDDACEATDGCVVEHDGTCPHGHPSWLMRLAIL